MQCREFEDNLSGYFKDATNIEAYREASATDDWSAVTPSNNTHQLLLQHASKCSYCADSLLKYLSIKDQVNCQDYPCLHLAYYTNNKDDRCIDFAQGLFSIIIDDVTGIVIGNCPWCGIKLNTSVMSVT